MTAYCTAVEVRAQAGGKTSTGDDTMIGVLIDAAQLAINGLCNRPDGFVADATATARVFTGSGEGVQFIDECAAITLVAVKDSPSDSTYTSWAAGDWLAFSGDPMRPDFNRTPYTGVMCTADGDYSRFTSGEYVGRGGFKPEVYAGRAVPTVQVTAKWGYALTVPAVIKQACITQVARWYRRGQSSWADTLANAELGLVQYRKVLDPDVEMMLIRARLVRPAI